MDEQNKVVFCIINKVASSTIKRLFTSSRGLQLRGEHTIQYMARNGFRQLASYSEEQRREIQRTYTTALIVRHPLDRLRSAFQNKIVNNWYLPRETHKKAIHKYRINKEDKSVKMNFEEFISALIDWMPYEKHWTSFEPACHPCAVDFDYILRLETLERDLKLFTTCALHTTYDKVYHDGTNRGQYHETSDVVKTNHYDKYVPDTKLLDDDLYKRLLDIGYGRDMEMFGYSFNRNSSQGYCGKSWGCC